MGKNKTEAKKELFLKLLKKSANNISIACKKADISRTTIYNWRRDDDDFRTEMDYVEEDLIDFTKTKLMELIDEKNVTAIIFYLKTKAKHHGFVERQEVAGVENKPISFINLIETEGPYED